MGNFNVRPYNRQNSGMSSSTSVEEIRGRQHENLEDEIVVTNSNNNSNNTQANTTNSQPAPPTRTGLYFGAPFFMGSGRSANQNATTTNNDDSLFGRDLAFLSSISGGRPPTPQVHQVLTIKCPVNLNKNSLQLIPIDENNKNLYKIQFMYDSIESGSVTVFYAVNETLSQNNQITFTQPPMHDCLPFNLGLGQVYDQPLSAYLDVTKYKEEELLYNAEKSFYPVVIVLQTDSAAYHYGEEVEEKLRTISIHTRETTDEPQVNTPTPSPQQVSKADCQITYAALIHCADDTYAIKPIKQKVQYNGKTYIIHEIYGLESTDTDGGRDCVICMTEPRNTTVLPCRHMCLCNSCAEVLRHQSNKCPICRSTVKSMIEIKINRAGEPEPEAIVDNGEEETTLVKKSKLPHPLAEEETEVSPDTV